MQSTLFVTSKSTEQIALNMSNRFYECEFVTVYESPKTTKLPKHKGRVIAIGGGSVIDTAKIMAGELPCYAIPTTASGAAMTSWAVIWKGNKKITVPTPRPILMEAYKYMKITLSEKASEHTRWDCICHIKDSRNSKYSTPESLAYCDIAEMYLKKGGDNNLIEAGNFAGRAIEITGTNFYHCISYVLTLDYGLSHGEALKEAVLMRNKWPWGEIIGKARKYKKFKDGIQ